MFDIALPDDGAEGRIVIGAYSESFAPERGGWDASAYRASWLRSAAFVLQDGFARFLVSGGAPGEAMYTTFPAWRRGADVLVQKSFLLASLTRDFAAPEDAERYEAEFSELGESGAPLSTWRCALRDVAEFERVLRGLRAQ